MALLAGKTVLVTAAAGTGIGFAAAKRCAEEGARVALSDRHERRLAESAEALAPILGEKPPRPALLISTSMCPSSRIAPAISACT